MNKNLQKIIVVCGATGIGKTSISIALAKEFNGEIISADSMQVYKYMNIGTAKPTKEEQSKIKHHLIDFISPDVDFNAFKFHTLANEKIDELKKKQKLPFIVGGTGLYIKTLIYGLSEAKNVKSEIVLNLEKEEQEKGKLYLYEKLKNIDSETAKKIHPNDTYRVIRAISVYESSGTKIADFQKKHKFQTPHFNALKIGLEIEREKLYKQINKRVDIMLENGFINEVKSLLKIGYNKKLKSMNSIGYKQICSYLSNEILLDEAVEDIKKETRRYAKRQLTWFRKDKDIKWFSPLDFINIKKKIKAHI